MFALVWHCSHGVVNRIFCFPCIDGESVGAVKGEITEVAVLSASKRLLEAWGGWVSQ